MNKTIDHPAGVIRRPAQMSSADWARMHKARREYNGGRPLDVHGIAKLCDVQVNTVYSWIQPDDQQEHGPSMSYLPDELPGGGWDPAAVISWAIQAGKIGWNGEVFVRRHDLPRLLSPGKIRRPHPSRATRVKDAA